MDFFVILIALIFLVYFDTGVLKRINPPLYEVIWGAGRFRWISFFAVAICLIGFQKVVQGTMGEGRFMAQTVLQLVLISVVGSYLFRRRQFKEACRFGQYSSFQIASDDRLRMISQATGIIFEWIFIILIFILGLESTNLFSLLRHQELAKILLTALFSSLLMVVLIYRVTKNRFYPGFMKTVGLVPIGQSPPKSIFFSGFIGLGVAIVSSLLMTTRPSIPPTPLNEVLKNTDSSWAWMVFLLMALMAAPFLEEIIFRGYFFYAVQQFKGTGIAVYFIALIFSFLHVGQYWGDWLAILIVTFLGFVLTLQRAVTRSTIPSVVTHYVYNTGVVIIPVLILIASNPSYFKYQTAYSNLDSAAKEKLLTESIEHRPDFIEAYNDLAWLYAEEDGKLPEALRLIDRALSVAPQNSAYWDTKAEVLYKMGKFKEAIAIEKDLIQKNPDDFYFKKQLKKFKAAFERKSGG